MIIESEEHRAIILLGLRSVQIGGAAVDPELVRHIQLVHDVINAVENADVVGALSNEPSVVPITG
mgnify:CR=1 FL=1